MKYEEVFPNKQKILNFQNLEKNIAFTLINVTFKHIYHNCFLDSSQGVYHSDLYYIKRLKQLFLIFVKQLQSTRTGLAKAWFRRNRKNRLEPLNMQFWFRFLLSLTFVALLSHQAPPQMANREMPTDMVPEYSGSDQNQYCCVTLSSRIYKG